MTQQIQGEPRSCVMTMAVMAPTLLAKMYSELYKVRPIQ